MDRVAVAHELALVARELVSGVPVPPPAMVKAIYDWAVSNVATKRLKPAKEYLHYHEVTIPAMGLKGNKKELRDAQKAVEVWEKHASGGKRQWKKLTRTFKVNLSGWKYAKLVSDDAPLKLKVVLVDSLGASKYNLLNRTVIITTGIIDHHNLWDLKDRIEHEVLHWAQVDLIGDDFGKPSRKMRDVGVKQYLPLFDMGKQELHSLDDIEFYPMIQSKAAEFLNQSRLSAKEFVESSSFFNHLKKNNRQKWMKAVNEFLKLVG